MSVKRELIEILACPKCKGDVEERGMFLVCLKCKLAFPVLGGEVPDMIIEDAWDLKKAKDSKFRHKIKF